MPEMTVFESLHFLRPWWLLTIPVSLFIHWRLRRAMSAADKWQTAIAPHLLTHLLVGGGRAKLFRPYQLLTVAMILLAIALAGPAWERERSPFTEDRAPLVVALEMTPSMLAIDQPPTRLERAKQKIRDLLAARKGARTAIIAYAGSAHAVLPLTDDIDLVENFIDSLLPSRMPLEGDQPDKALALAEQLMRAEPAAGTIVYMTDGIDARFTEVFAEHALVSKNQVLLLAFGTEAGGPIKPEDGDRAGMAPGTDFGGLKDIAAAANGSLWRATVDDSDVERLIRRIRTHLVNAIDADEKLQWRDAGYYLTWPLALILLFWFRRGWTVQWQ